eukprot:GGOE01061837.1.p1 GENE.GGOE01061837.1~~GGOE01061837.1.p1  ORF type:complete len:389 (-),score=125.44 GGOE01061837.1:311-1477(-)
MPTIVVDNGTGFTKCGFAGDNFPRAVFPGMVGRPLLRSGERIGDAQLKDVMVGDECADLRHLLEVNYPMRHGIVRDWADMELLWEHTFKDCLDIDPTGCKILLTEAPLNSKANRERIVETMFQKFGFTHVFVGVQAVLTLYAQGLMSGLVCDSGDGCTHTVPVVQGFILPNAVKRTDLAGTDVTEYLVKLLHRRGYAFNRTADFDTVRQIKERFCYVACDFALEKRLAYETCVLEKSYQLPDGRVMRIGTERFEAPEVLFQPHLVDKDGGGIAEMVFRTIQDCAIDLRMEMYKHMVLSGGTTMFPGLPTRMENEIKERYLQSILKGDRTRLAKFKPRIEDPPRRKHMVFLGGAVLAQLMEDSEQSWISKAEYEEKGTKVIWEKCPSSV